MSKEIIDKINDRLMGLLMLDEDVKLTTRDVFQTFANSELEIYKNESIRMHDNETVKILDSIISMRK